MEEKQYLSVSALTKYIKYKFDYDVHLKKVLLKGEISNFKRHSRGHFYFTLKDDHSQISAIMFASSAKNIVFRPEDGMSVLVEGSISVYETSGNYQIYCDSMTEDGLGNLHVAYEQLKKKLENEGLFDPAHKQKIPKFPKAIAVLTSPTGAAVRDVIHIINRRYPLAKVIVYPTLVQGEYAKDDIVSKLKQANKDQLVDVIILGRGGGSIEDLWPFNEEEVAYAIFQSKIPIISSVGHETDFTISDFVADLRAPTPSGGAEIAVPDQVELLSYIDQLLRQSKTRLQTILRQKQQRLSVVQHSYVFTDPMRITERSSRKLDLLSEKLERLKPTNRIMQSKQQVLALHQKLNAAIDKLYRQKETAFSLTINSLQMLNPLAIMAKGYSVAKKDQIVIKSISQVEVDDTIQIQINDGILHTIVTKKEKGE